MPIESLRKYPKILRDVMEHWRAMVTAAGYGEVAAHELALEAAEYLRKHWAGEPIYIPKGVSFERELLKQAIFERWDTKNTHELCQEFKISEIYLRRLHEEARKEAARERQRALF